MGFRTSASVFASFLLLLAGAASAGITGVHDNGGPEPANGGGVTVVNGNTGADDFTLASAQKINGAVFWTLEEDGAWDGSVSPVFFSDSAGVPGAYVAGFFGAPDVKILSREVINTGIALGPFDLTEYKYVIEFPEIVLGAGTYWFDLYLQDGIGAGNPFIFWESSDAAAYGDGNALSSNGVPPSWFDVQFELAYQLFYRVPEPGMILIFGLGGLLLLRAVGRNNKRLLG